MAEPSRGQGADRQTLLVWLLVLACVLILALLQPRLPELKAFPAAWTLPVTDWLNTGMDGFVGSDEFAGGLDSWSPFPRRKTGGHRRPFGD
jgi:hypothetical protein